MAGFIRAIRDRYRRRLLAHFYRLYRWEQRFRRRFTATGQGFLVTMGIAGVIGINTRLNLANQIFTILAVAMAIALISSLRLRLPLRVQRRLPSCATVDKPLCYHLIIENLGDHPQTGLRISDQLQYHPPSLEEFRRHRDHDDQHRNAFDRWVGYPRWLWLLHRRRGADNASQPLPALAPHQRLELPAVLQPRRRGDLRFQGLCVTRADPLGLCNAIQMFPEPDTLLVLPHRYTVPHLSLGGGRLYQPGGITSAASLGDSQEFISLRDYQPGDSLRDIHWKSWARAGKPIVRQYRPEYFTRHALILDTAIESGQESRFETAVSVAASFVSRLETRENLLDLLFVGSRLYRFSAGPGLSSSWPLLQVLAAVDPVYDPSLTPLCQAVLGQARQFSGCILVLIGWDQQRQSLEQSLQSQGVETLTLLIGVDEPPATTSGRVIPVPLAQTADILQGL